MIASLINYEQLYMIVSLIWYLQKCKFASLK